MSITNSVQAITGNKILIISSYSHDYQWSNSIIDGITTKIRDNRSDIELNIEYLSSERFDKLPICIQRMELFLSNYRQDEMPLAIILVSDEAWMAYRAAVTERFKDVPLFLCGVKPHTIDIDTYEQNKTSLSLDMFSNTVDLMKGYNATGVLREMNIQGYFDAMRNFIPNLDRFTLITDKRFYGIYTRLLFEQYVNTNYPKYSVRYIDARFANTDSLFNALPQITPQTGLLLTSWLTGEAGFEYSKQYVYKRMASTLNTPIFITNNIGFDTDYFLGGYFVDAEFWGAELGDLLIKMMDGKSIKSMPPLTYKDGTCQINWKVFNKFNLQDSNLIPNVNYVNRPVSLFEKYRHAIILIIAVIILIVLSYCYIIINNRRLKRAQREAQLAIEQAASINTRLLESQQQLETALKKAETADILKSAFIAHLDDQIRAPLNVITGFASLIASMDDPEDRSEAAMQIKQNSEELLHVIMEVLDLVKLESGLVAFSFDKLSADALCRDVIIANQTKCAASVQIKYCPPESDIILTSDHRRLPQVLSNILSNATKFTQEGYIELGFFSYNDELIEFYVKDTGIGISEDKIDVIFDRFVKLDSYISGAGLGLSVAKQIINILGGEIGVVSELGVGSRFWFRIKK